MSNQTESRGWEIEDNYQQHEFDDPDIDLAAFKERSGGAFYALLVTTFVLCIGMWVINMQFRPPELVFPKISVPATNIIGEPGWRVSCIYFSPTTKVLRPNYGNPACAEAAAKKRGEF